MTFYDRLYLGFEAEYFVVSRLFAAGMEAFKLPGDFGFDLIVGNIRERTFDGTSGELNARFPHVVQVKSRRLSRSAFHEGPSGRPEADAQFSVSADDWNRLLQEERASLVSVLFYRHPWLGSLPMVEAFWLPATELTTLGERGYFRVEDSTEARRYVVRIRLMPTQDRDTLLDALVEVGHLTHAGRTRLSKELPEALPVQWRASPYLSLLRPDRGGTLLL